MSETRTARTLSNVRRELAEVRAQLAEAQRENRTLRFKADPVPWRDRALTAEQQLAEAQREIERLRRGLESIVALTVIQQKPGTQAAREIAAAVLAQRSEGYAEHLAEARAVEDDQDG